MSLLDHLYAGTLAGQIAKLEKTTSQLARKASRGRRVTSKALEQDLGRVALLLRSVTELCIEKGVFSEGDLARKLEAVDIADGVADGRLDAEVVMPGEEKLANLQPLPVVQKAKKKSAKRKKRRKR